MDKRILDHFKKVDPILFREAEKYEFEPHLFKKHTDYFESLCREIVGQQLSGKAAGAIWKKFKLQFPGQKVTSKNILKISEDKLRSSGVSWAKVRSVKDLAQKVIKSELEFERLDELSDKEIMDQLVKVKGIGPWTAEMFLMFTLGREDVFSFGDLGLRNGIKKLYGLNSPAGEPTKEEIEKIVEKWTPYKSYACQILWQSLDDK